MMRRGPVMALIRYRFMATIRRSHWLFALTAVLIAAPGLLMIEPADSFLRRADTALREAAIAGIACSLAHLFTLVAACGAQGSPKERLEGTRPDDLLDSAPVRPSDLFWGDAVGIFAVVMTIHLCVLPMLAFTFATSPLGLRGLLLLEACTVAILTLASMGAAWAARTSTPAIGNTRGLQSTSLFLIFVLTIVALTTRWEDFRDAIGELFFEPSPAKGRELLAAIEHPIAFVMLLAILYAGYLVFFYRNAMRTADR